MYEFILPDIGEGISEALLISWAVKPGDHVEEDQELATISTDKVNVELPSPRAGTVAQLCWNPGDTVEVGAVFLRIATDADEGVAAGEDETVALPEPAGEESRTSESSVLRAALPDNKSAAAGDSPVTAAPSTRKLAQELGIKLSTIAGSGQAGRILRRDVESTTTSAQTPGAGPSVAEPHREAPSGVRAAMAERMGYSVHTLAHSTMNFEVPADGLLALHAHLAAPAAAENIKISMSVILVKCVATALTRHARFNATIDEQAGGLLLHEVVNLGLALAGDEGLTVPVLRDVQDKSLFDLARDLTDIVTRGRNGQLQAEDYRHGTFTLSNTGSLERATILSTRPVINAPQAAILWVSKIKTRPRVIDDRLEAGPMMNCSLSFDHRFIDGADSVDFINDLADVFEAPEQTVA